MTQINETTTETANLIDSALEALSAAVPPKKTRVKRTQAQMVAAAAASDAKTEAAYLVRRVETLTSKVRALAATVSPAALELACDQSADLAFIAAVARFRASESVVVEPTPNAAPDGWATAETTTETEADTVAAE
jgi:hypothetical protein